MKVAVFTDTYLPQVNGVTNTIYNMEKYFIKNNVQYKILAPEYAAQAASENVETFYSVKFLMYPECRLSLVTNGRVKQILSDFEPDMVHAVTEFNMGWAGVSYAAKNRIPCISTYTTNFGSYLNYFKLDILSGITWEYFKWFHNQNALTLCPSQDAKQLLLEKGIKRVDIWGRGIDSNLYSPSKRSDELRRKFAAKDKIMLLYVGRISAEKDMDILFEAYRQIKRDYGSKTILVIAGGGPMLEKFQSENKDAIFTGYVKGEKLAELYASADIFTFPSSTETLGNVVLEAMASGIPVVAADSGGVRENVIDGFNGLLCRPRDVQSYYSGIKMLIDNHALRLQMGKDARNYAIKKDWENVFDKLMVSYSDVINKRESIAA